MGFGDFADQIDQRDSQRTADKQRYGQSETVQFFHTDFFQQAALSLEVETDYPAMPTEINGVRQPYGFTP